MGEGPPLIVPTCLNLGIYLSTLISSSLLRILTAWPHLMLHLRSCIVVIVGVLADLDHQIVPAASLLVERGTGVIN